MAATYRTSENGFSTTPDVHLAIIYANTKYLDQKDIFMHIFFLNKIINMQGQNLIEKQLDTILKRLRVYCTTCVKIY